MTTQQNISLKKIIKPNSVYGMHVKFWVPFCIVFLVALMLPALSSPMELIGRVLLILIGLFPLVLVTVYARRYFDKSMTLGENQVTIYEFGRTVSISFDQIAELIYTDLHQIPGLLGRGRAPFLKITTKDNTISYVATAGSWNLNELKAFYNSFPDTLKTPIDKDRALIQGRMNRMRVGRSGFLDQTTARDAKTALLKYALLFAGLIILLILVKSLYS